MNHLHIENLNGPEEVPGRQRKRNKRYKRRGKGGIGIHIFLCLVVLGALTGCLFLVTKNHSLQTEVDEAMAYIDEASKVKTYTEEEVQNMVSEAREKAAAEASSSTEDEILSIMKSMMEDGEGTAAMLRYFYPEEIVVASDNRYYFFPILDTLRHHTYDEEQFIMNKDNILEYFEDGQVVSRKGIDVSRYQPAIDWEKVAGDGVEYAFIRLGIRGSSEGKLVLDDTYQDNMEGALGNDIDVGVYFFTQALNREEAVEEANFVLENIEPYDVNYPIVLDVEEITTKNPRTSEMTREQWTEVCIAFCDTIKNAGYTPMIYGNLKTFMLMLDMERLEEYEKWFAYYRTPLYFPYEFSIWQYTADGAVDGIKGKVDLNISMKDWGNGG